MLEPGTVTAGEHQSAIPSHDGSAPLGTLLVPGNLPKPMRQRLHRLAPSLEALMAAARDRQAMNAELEASRRELERFFDLTSDLPYIGGETHLRRVNPAFERTFGYTTNQLLSRPFLELIHPSDRDRTGALIETLLSSGGAAQ